MYLTTRPHTICLISCLKLHRFVETLGAYDNKVEIMMNNRITYYLFY